MTPEQFSYWLQGFVEIQETTAPSERQWEIIKDHLQQVFNKKTRYPQPLIVEDNILINDNNIKPLIDDNINTIIC